MTPTLALDPLALFRLDGRVAVVTGASSGLGDRFARVLDAVGARVVVAARRADRLEALAGELDGRRRRAGGPADARGSRAARRRRRSTRAGGSTCWSTTPASAAGRARGRDARLVPAVMEVNVTASWHLCKLARDALIADGGGSIVNVASMLGHVGVDAGEAGQLLRQQGRRRQPDPRAGPAVGPPQRAGQRPVPGLVPVAR